MRNLNVFSLFRKAGAFLLAALLVCSICTPQIKAAEFVGSMITTQPESVEVSYPEGAKFHVEVFSPELVTSYQWQMTDGKTLFNLDGTSATTDTLVIPSTRKMDSDMLVRCLITDFEGNITATDTVTLTITNKDEDKSVLYIGDYAVEPGTTLDLSEKGLGTGTAVFEEDGTTITLDSFVLENTETVFDHTISSAGLSLTGGEKEYHLVLQNACSITGAENDEESETGNAAFSALFERTDVPVLRIEGDGSLSITGSYAMIETDADVEIAADIKAEADSGSLCDGIVCRNLTVDEDVNLDLNVNGSGIVTKEDLLISSGSTVNIRSNALLAKTSSTSQYLIYSYGFVNMENADVSLYGCSDSKVYKTYVSANNTYAGIQANAGPVHQSGGSLSIEMKADALSQTYAGTICGIGGDKDSAGLSLENGASLNLKVEAGNVNSAMGIHLPGDVTVGKDCTVSADILACNEAWGIKAGGTLAMEDATVDVKAAAGSEGSTYGMIAGGLNINMTDEKYSIHSIAENGIALAADTGAQEKEASGFEKNHTPEFITLGETTAVVTPSKSVISTCSIPTGSAYTRAETIYDKSDKNNPASEVVISYGEQIAESGSGMIYGIIGAAAVIAAAAFFILKGKKKKDQSAAV